MKKITDRFLLGVVSGLAGNLTKTAVETVFSKFGYKNTAIKKAAGIFLKKSDISTPSGKLVGVIADNMIAAGLGVTCVYWLTLMGKDKYILKGAGLGAAEWATIYGVFSKMGATSIYPNSPYDTLVSFLSHMAFGATKITVATKFGDTRLFKPANLTKTIDNPQEFDLTTANSKGLHRPLIN